MSAILTNVYNHYLTTYAPKGTTPFDTHKKSELRSVYNSIVKLNKESPWYLPDNSAETQSYAIDLKENARALKNTIASLGGLDESNLLNKKTAFSSNINLATATCVSNFAAGEALPSLELEVLSLAKPQENLGYYLPNENVELPADNYSFDVGIGGINYEFQFNIRENETNKDLQERLVRLINNANIGISADVHEMNGKTSLRLASTATGIPEDKEQIFTVTDDRTSKKAGTVEYLGISFNSKAPTNASFRLNGEARSAASNHFTIGKLFEIELTGVSVDGETTHIGLKTDVDSLTENVSQLVGGYNDFIKAVSTYSEAHPKSSRLASEMGTIASLYRNDLDSLGISLDADNTLTIDANLLKQSAMDEDALSSLTSLRNFTHSLVRKTSQVSLDPMRYADKTVVAYKNPGHNFSSPYTPSPYSGMMFNSYC